MRGGKTYADQADKAREEQMLTLADKGGRGGMKNADIGMLARLDGVPACQLMNC